jgi:tRNA(Ile)-lysidine synthase
LLNPERLDALFGTLRGARRLLLAVSGGPDSTALLSLMAEWRGGPEIHAATVDHGLRREAAAEAAAVGALCASLGVPHATLAWDGEKPKTRLQERAREARYRLLTDHARAIGAEVMATAHHLDDQAETVLMRLMRGSGVAGLAGMAARSNRDGVTLARPLLALPKAELVAHCVAKGLPFADDPSNCDPRFTRARLRRLMAEIGLDARALTRLAARAERAEEALQAMTAAAEARLGLAEAGACRVEALLAEPSEIRLRLIGRALSRTGGKPVGLEKLEALGEAAFASASASRRFSANVAGARLTVSRTGILEIKPEPPRRTLLRGSMSSEFSD